MTTLSILLEGVTVLDEHGTPALDSITLRVERGEAVALVGHSGGGKSTILRIIAGLSRPHSGRVSVLGLEVGELAYGEMRRLRTSIGYVFESGGLWGNRSVFDNIALPLLYHPVPPLSPEAVRERVEKVAGELGIRAELTQPSYMANASVKKRTAVARALVLSPDVLLIDEPQAGLVPREARLVSDAIERRRNERSMTVVFADNDGYLDPYYADKVVHIDHGRIVAGDLAAPEIDRAAVLGVSARSLGARASGGAS